MVVVIVVAVLVVVALFVAARAIRVKYRKLGQLTGAAAKRERG